ncbi:MAG: ABC transporter ATP-binding protein, partial [Anaerolineaceae bacterium]|nr:ABC transporter ATP-binding protein [Anaerolineaceae bacterium]
STELEEVLSLSDRIAVMYEGEIMGIIPGKDADIHQIGQMMAGVLRLNKKSEANQKEVEKV